MPAGSVGLDHQAHLSGSKAFTHAELFEVQPSKLRQRTYWVALTQEIHTSLVTHRPLDINLNIGFLRQPFNLSDEHEWSACVTLTLGRVLMFCFETRTAPQDSYEALRTISDELSEMLPVSFHPYFRENSEVSSFTKIWMSTDYAGRIKTSLALSFVWLIV